MRSDIVSFRIFIGVFAFHMFVDHKIVDHKIVNFVNCENQLLILHLYLSFILSNLSTTFLLTGSGDSITIFFPKPISSS